MAHVSICIPTYENPSLALRAVKSTFEQTFIDFECIVTDDSVSGAVAAILTPFLKDKRFIYRKNPSPLGAPANWNYAIKLASGKYIKMLHHDDYFSSSESLEKFVEAAKRAPASGFIISDCCNVSVLRKSPHDIDVGALNLCIKKPFSILMNNYIGSPSVTMVLRDINVEYDENIKWLVDVEYYKQIIDITGVVHVPERLVNINFEDEHQITHACLDDKFLQLRELIYVFAKHSRFYFLKFCCAINIYRISSMYDEILPVLHKAGMAKSTCYVYLIWHFVFTKCSLLGKIKRKLSQFLI